MQHATPHYLLFSEARRPTAERGRGAWRFVLETLDGSQRLEAADIEPRLRSDQLELLAVVRGLEALEQPSRVTLVTTSRYVSRGLMFGLEQWRENDWRWERYGRMHPITNRDLWQRIDRALHFHRVECRNWRFAERSVDAANVVAGSPLDDAALSATGDVRAATDRPAAADVRSGRPRGRDTRGVGGHRPVRRRQSLGVPRLGPFLASTWASLRGCADRWATLPAT